MGLASWTPTLPPSETVAWLAPLLMGIITGSGYLAGRLKLRHGARTGDTRKLFHFVIFTSAALLGLTFGLGAVNLLGGLRFLYVLTAVRVGEGNVFYEGMARESDRPDRSRYIIVPLLSTAAGGILSSAFFGAHATVGYIASGWGDAVAEPVGIRLGKRRYRVPAIGGGVTGTRSLEGSAAVFIASFAGVLAVLQLGGLSTSSPSGTALAALLVALATTVTEAASPHGLDNLTVQLAASGVAHALALALA